MANPQCENGHIKVANEIMEAIAKIHLSDYEGRIIHALWRKTYGWHKKADHISYSQWEEMTGIDRRHVARTLKHLIARKIIAQSGNGYHIEYSFQKDYSLWEALPQQATVRALPIQDRALPQQATEALPQQATTKERKQYTKERASTSFEGWLERVRTASNPISELGEMLSFLSDGKEKPDYSRLGKMAREHSGPGYIADLIWGCARARPKGIWLDYIQGMLRKKKEEPAGDLKEL